MYERCFFGGFVCFKTRHRHKENKMKMGDKSYIDQGWSAASLTRPGLLPRQGEAGAVRVGVADVSCLSGTVDWQHTALLAVGRPAAVLHIPRGPHTPHHSVI